MKTAEQLDQEILALIGQGLNRRDDEQFNRLALDLFEYQFAFNLPFQKFCQGRGAQPTKIASWREIPAVPTSAFKDASLACFPIEKAEAVFETSGTTQSVEKRGRHYLEKSNLYRASIIPNFAAHLLPDGTQPPLLMLIPSPEEAPHSSLSFMMGVVAEEFGRRGVFHFVQNGKLDTVRLSDALRMAEGFGEPVLLLGTAFAFMHFFDSCRERNQSFRLPAGSRAMETGGFKGRSREVTRDELLEIFDECLAIPGERAVNEYGMTELGVQFYDQKLRSTHSAQKSVPPWSRVMIVDPATGIEAGQGERGLIRAFDLTNRSSVMAIQTEDIGMRVGEGFEVLGRADGVEARGCSIAADEFLTANNRK